MNITGDDPPKRLAWAETEEALVKYELVLLHGSNSSSNETVVERTPASAAVQVINRKMRQKITKKIEDLYNTINQIDLIDIPFKCRHSLRSFAEPFIKFQ